MQETRNLKTGVMLTLALEDGCCHTFKGKRFPVKRYVYRYLYANTCCVLANYCFFSQWLFNILSLLLTVASCDWMIDCWSFKFWFTVFTHPNITYWNAVISALSGTWFDVLAETLPPLLWYAYVSHCLFKWKPVVYVLTDWSKIVYVIIHISICEFD